METRTEPLGKTIDDLMARVQVSQPSPDSSPRSGSSELAEQADALARASIPARHRETFRANPRNGSPWWTSGPRELLDKRDRAYECLLARGGSVLLIGRRGTGKTQLALELASRLVCDVPIVRRTPTSALVAYHVLQDLFDDEKLSWRTVSDEPAGLRKARDTALLVLDEIQERYETAWEDRALTLLFDYRYREMLRTILVANVEAAHLAEKLPASIVSRMGEIGMVIDCDWPSFRGAR